MAQAIAQTPGTCDAQRQDLTAFSSVREPIDNGIAQTAYMTDQDRPIALLSDVQFMPDSRGVEHKVFLNVSQTAISDKEWGTLGTVMGPDKHGGGGASITSVHGHGVSNTCLGITDSNQGELLMLRLKPKERDHATEGWYDIGVQRIGQTPNDHYTKHHNGDQVRACCAGNLLTHRKESPSGNHSFSGSFDMTSGPRPSLAEFVEGDLLTTLGPGTKINLLKNTPVAPGVCTEVDACDGLLNLVDSIVKRTARLTQGQDESTAASMLRVRNTDMLITLCWNVRRQIQVVDGVFSVDGLAMHEAFADVYMNSGAETRVVLKEMGIKQVQPKFTLTRFAEHTVDWNANSVAKAHAAGTLVPFADCGGKGPTKSVLVNAHLLLESHTVPLALLTTKSEGRVLAYMPSSLVVGDPLAFSTGVLFSNAEALRDCSKARASLLEFMKAYDINRWTLNGEFGAFLKDCFPRGYEVTESELATFRDDILVMRKLKKSLSTKTKEEMVKSMGDAELFLEGYNDCSKAEYLEHKVRLHCQEGGTEFIKGLIKLLGYRAAGNGNMHLATLIRPAHLNKPKTCLVGDTEANLCMFASIMRRNLAILHTEVTQLAAYMHVTREQSVAEEAADQQAQQRAIQKRQENESRGEAQAKRQEQARAAQAAQAAKNARLRAAGVFATPAKHKGKVQFVKGGNSEPQGVMKKLEEVEAALRRGQMRLEGKLYTFVAPPLTGVLYNRDMGPGTEIVLAANQDQGTDEYVIAESSVGQSRTPRTAAASRKLVGKVISFRGTNGQVAALNIKTPTSEIGLVQNPGGVLKDTRLAKFAQAIATAPRGLKNCFGGGGSLELQVPAEKDSKEMHTVRFHLLLCQPTGKIKRPNFGTTQTKENGKSIVDVFIDPHRIEFQPPDTLPQAMQVFWLIHKVGHHVINEYAHALGLDKETTASLYGEMVATQANYDTLGDQTAHRKRPASKSTAEPSEQRQRTSAGASSSSAQPLAVEQGCEEI